MNKEEFISDLQQKLSGIPEKILRDTICFYEEMIEDRMEEGLSEEEAIRDIGNTEEIATQILADIPLLHIVKDKIKPKRKLQGWEIALLVIGSPLWISLLVAVFAMVISIYAVIWSVIVSLWAAFASLIACAVCGIGIGAGFIFIGNGLAGAFLLGAGLILAGLSIFLFYGCKAATNGTAVLTKKIALGIKSCFIKKEKGQ
ncbi:MAG: DUF1700 domain-containing protein [Clostridia bacterium]|nr:DUF1700 domain-containing protein [Clostridia bacterium]